MAMAAVDAGDDVASHLLKVFQEFDTDGNGRIDASELRSMMERVGLSMTRDEAAEVLEEMDEICQGLLATATQSGNDSTVKYDDFNDDGEVSFEEFYAVLMKLEGARAYTANSLGAAASGGGSTKLTIRSIAGTIDQLRARTDQKKRWRAKQANGKTLQDVRTDGPGLKLDEDRKREIDEMLTVVPLLATLAPQAKAQLLDLLTLRRYRKGQDIVRRGDEGNEFFLILKGRVHVLTETDDAVIVELGPGQHFGERSLIISEPRNATVRCAMECDVACMHRVAFTHILDSIGAKERERRRRLANKRRMQDKRRQRDNAKAERARAREKAGRKRPTGRLRRFSAIDDWSANMEERDAQERAQNERAGEAGDTRIPTQGALTGIKRRVRRASVEIFSKVKETISATSSASSPRAVDGSSSGSNGSKDEGSNSSEDHRSNSSEDKFDSPPPSAAGNTSPTKRALAGVKRRVRRASVTVAKSLSKIKHNVLNTQQKQPAQKACSDRSEEQEDDDDEQLPPAKVLLETTMAELDSLLCQQAKRHESAQRGWERAVAARKPVLESPPAASTRRQSSGRAALPILNKSAAAGAEVSPLQFRRAAMRGRGGVGAAGQTLVMGTMAVGVPHTLDGNATATRHQAKRKANSARALPSLELRDPARDRRFRTARFQSNRAAKGLKPAPHGDKMPIGYPWSDADIDEWLDEIAQ